MTNQRFSMEVERLYEKNVDEESYAEKGSGDGQKRRGNLELEFDPLCFDVVKTNECFHLFSEGKRLFSIQSSRAFLAAVLLPL